MNDSNRAERGTDEDLDEVQPDPDADKGPPDQDAADPRADEGDQRQVGSGGGGQYGAKPADDTQVSGEDGADRGPAGGEGSR